MSGFFSRLKNAVKRALLACALPFAILIAPELAHSHTAPFGITGYPVLVLHPYIILDHALSLVAAALLAGQQRALGLLDGLAALVVGLFSGFSILVLFPGFPGDLFFPLAGATATGLVVALAPDLDRRVVAAIVIFAGFAVGLNTYPEDGLLFVLAATVIGLMVGAGLLFTLVAWLASRAKPDWQRIGVRIAGSWISAICCLVLALALKP